MRLVARLYVIHCKRHSRCAAADSITTTGSKLSLTDILSTRCKYIIDDDISNGREIDKLPALNYKRREPAPTQEFHYATEHVNLEQGVDVNTSLKMLTGCQCQGDCGADCACARFGRCPSSYYDFNGLLQADYLAKSCDAIRECDVLCKCNPMRCTNMVIQRGGQLCSVLFKTKSRG